MFPVNLLDVGRRAVISQLTGDVEEVRRLRELGIRDGQPIEVIQSGTPCIARIGDRNFCFRSGELLNIFVEAEWA